MILATCLALQIEKIEETTYFAEELQPAKLVDHYHEFYFYFNISSIESSYRTLLSNVYILKVKDKNESNVLTDILDSTCMQIENELAKFNNRNKRSLFDGVGSAVRFITGNLDQNDLREISTNLNSLYSNQEIITKQVNKFTSFANHITNRYETDLKKIRENLNVSIKAVNDINQKLEIRMSMQYQIFLAEKLLEIMQMIQRTISLAYNNMANLEIMSKQELIIMIEHLKVIYKKEELIELNNLHPFKLIEFAKLKVVSTGNIMTCILYFPILKPNPYEYKRIYPMPDPNGQILLPPAKFHLLGLGGELWTNENCIHISPQTICFKDPHKDNCSLHQPKTCKFAKAINDYQLTRQLENGKILVITKQPQKVMEACKDKIEQEEVVANVLLMSTSRRDCKIMVNGNTFSNAYSHFNYTPMKMYQYDLKMETTNQVSLNEEHMDDFEKLKEEATELEPIKNLHQGIHVAHFSVTAILTLLMIIVVMIMLITKKYKYILNRNGKVPREKGAVELEDLPFRSQDVDALS